MNYQLRREKITKIWHGIMESELKRLHNDIINEFELSGISRDDSTESVKKYVTVDDVKLDFDKEYIEELRLKSNDRCALTNIEVSWEPKMINTGSIDRIDKSKGYSKDNIQIVLWHVNNMKTDLSNDEAITILDEIINFR